MDVVNHSQLIDGIDWHDPLGHCWHFTGQSEMSTVHGTTYSHTCCYCQACADFMIGQEKNVCPSCGENTKPGKLKLVNNTEMNLWSYRYADNRDDYLRGLMICKSIS